MRRAILAVTCLLLAPYAQSGTVSDLIAQLQDVKPDLEAVIRLDANLARSVGVVSTASALPLQLAEPRSASYFQVAANVDADAMQQVAVIGVAAPAVALQTNCAVENLQLTDVTCTPPHGGGFDGRLWVRMVCATEKAPTPYDWQLARLSGDQADVFAWNDDPTYAYVQGANGSYQVSALSALGQVSLNFTLPASCGGASKPR